MQKQWLLVFLFFGLIVALACLFIFTPGPLLYEEELPTLKEVIKEYYLKGIDPWLINYEKRNGTFPESTEPISLRELFTEFDLISENNKGRKLDYLDPWGKDYFYKNPGVKNPDSYDLWSFGPDGVESADDIGNWD